MNRLSVLVAVSALAACSHAKPPVAPSEPAEQPTAQAQPTAQPKVAVSPNVGVSDDLAKQCKLHFDAAVSAPKFDYDQASLLPADRSVLEQVATCLTSGPLRGRAITLIGRADPRGTEEYNLGLGSHRASSVRDYLKHLGVTEGQLQDTTRGSLDATGTDETSWRTDRRVDLELAAG